MGGLNPGSGAALRKVLLPGAGTAWWTGTAGGSTDARARAADEQTMQEAQVGQSPSGNAACSSWAGCDDGVTCTAWCSAQSDRAAAAGACAVAVVGAPWCVGARCCPAMEIAIMSAAMPRKGVNTIIRMTSQKRMGR